MPKRKKNPSSRRRLIFIFALALPAIFLAKSLISRFTQIPQVALTESSANACVYSFSLPQPSAAPTTTALSCSNCQYQFDSFWGPVIESFNWNSQISYSHTKRLINTLQHNYGGGYPACALSPVTPKPAPVLPTLPPGCEDPVARGLLVGNSNNNNITPAKGGYVTAWIENKSTSCTYQVGFATYKADGDDIDIQNLYDFKTATLTPGAKITQRLKVPMFNDADSCHNLSIPPLL